VRSSDASSLYSGGSATQATGPRHAGSRFTVLARIDEATGPIHGWDITDNTVWIAAGNKLITLLGQTRPEP